MSKLPFRIGYGIDVHRLEDGYPLIIGGVKLNSSFGAVGHSDADVLIHAICDALLGALALRDIGYHFSDTDPKYKGIDSTILLEEVVKLIHAEGYFIGNIDSTIVLEKPKVNPHIEAMQNRLSPILKIEKDALSIKATTHEKVDSFGEVKAIKAYAACILFKE
jgi:2-C-methyl-D-erythritol 2,4-cyclodiphosphate synthase